MTSDIALFVEEQPLVDTHEHLVKESDFGAARWDILTALFNTYIMADLEVAGATRAEIERLLDPSAGDVADRFRAVQRAWDATRQTGYGEAVRFAAEAIFGVSELTAETLRDAAEAAAPLQQAGSRLRLLRDVANLDHVQIDDQTVACSPDPSGPDFFLYDLSMHWPIAGRIDVGELHAASGVEVSDLASLGEALSAAFAAHADTAVAIKSQHAYERTLAWQERDDAESARALAAVLAGRASDGDEVCVGDWVWGRVAELSIEYELPFKIHTGYYFGAGSPMPVERIRPGQLSPLLARYPQARFVLMHAAYPFDRELIAVAKHFPNVWIDLCWAWAIDPYSACDTLRRFLHAVPSNKLFAFGGDTVWPTSAVGYALQARRWLARALEAEVAAGDLTEHQAISIARRVMHDNQYACFDVEGTRRAILDRATVAP